MRIDEILLTAGAVIIMIYLVVSLIIFYKKHGGF